MMPSTPDSATDATTFRRVDPAARRTRMRDFQTRLVERLQAARGGSDVRASQLGVLIGETRWLFDLQQAGEIVAVSSITKVPLTQPWFLGLANIRGNLISVVDFAQFKGGAASAIDKEARIIAFAPALSFNAGLLVSKVLGLRNVADMEQYNDSHDSAEATGKTRDPGNGPALRYRDSDQQIWHVLDLAAVSQDPAFLHVGL